MAKIEEYLKNILSARYGEEVRSSIHDSIKAINDAQEDVGIDEIIDARIGWDKKQYKNLGEAIRTQITEALKTPYSPFTTHSHLESRLGVASIDDIFSNIVFGFNRDDTMPYFPVTAGTFISIAGSLDSLLSDYKNYRSQIIIGIDNVLYFRGCFGNKWNNWVKLDPGHIEMDFPSIENITSKVVLSSTKRKIVLLGDSITQGQGSTGYVTYTNSESQSVRGNGPDYPSKGPDYKIGDYIYSDGSRVWYEALDGNGWAQKMKKYFESEFNCVVKNYGMSGISSKVLLKTLQSITLVDDADIAIVTIGTNDRELNDPSSTYTNISNIVDILTRKGIKSILVGNIPASSTNESSYSIHMNNINHIIYKVANEKSIPFISLYSEFLDYAWYRGIDYTSILKDGLHPNDEGYEVMYRILTEKLGLVPKAF